MLRLCLDVDKTDIIIRVYANFQGLVQVLRGDGTVQRESDVMSFAQGFMRDYGLFDFIDIETKKEDAIQKIRGM